MLLWKCERRLGITTAQLLLPFKMQLSAYCSLRFSHCFFSMWCTVSMWRTVSPQLICKNYGCVSTKCGIQITVISFFYVLLTVHHVMILGKWPTWRTILFYVFIFVSNSLHVSRTSCSSWGETNWVNTTSGNCHCVSVAVSCAGRKWTSSWLVR
jgi:hypothetical protein